MIVGVPCVNRPDLLLRMLDSIDEPCTVLIIDNSPDGGISDIARNHEWDTDMDGRGVIVRTLWFPANLGVAASWNLTIKYAPSEPYWVIANADTEFAPGALAALRSEAERGGPRWVGIDGDWRAFALTVDAVRVAGLFDENYHPVYVEDCDYEHRCRLAGVMAYTVPTGSRHEGSAAISSDPRLHALNGRTHRSNLAYHEAKWGGSIRGGETHATPFGRGGSVRDWELVIDRLRDNAWA